MQRNRKPHEAARSSQVSTAVNDESDSWPRNFGVESAGSGLSGTRVLRCMNDRISMLSRFVNNERKWDNCRGVQRGDSSVIDRSVGEK